MNSTKAQTNYEFDDEPDGIEEAYSSTNNHRNEPEISRNDELEFAGYDEEADELLASEYRIKQENEPTETLPVSEKPSVRMFSVLVGTGVVFGIFGILWFTFFAPKPVRQPAKTSTPEVTSSVPHDESAELKSRLAFQDQQRTIEAQPLTPKERPTLTPQPVPKPTPKPVPVARTPEPPRRVQNFNPPPRVVQTIPLVPRPIQPPPRLITSPPPSTSKPSPTAEKVDPYERWAQLAALGQIRGEVAEVPTAESSTASPNTPNPTVPTTPNLSPTASAISLPFPQDKQQKQINSQPKVDSGIATVTIGDTNPTAMSPGEIGILNRTPVNQNSDVQIAIGSSAKAKVIVPMIWDEAGQSPTGGRFAVQLTEDIKAADGGIALPSGTILITEVNNVTRSNRLVSQSVVAVVYPDSSGRIHQVPIPAGHLVIRGENNQPLIAQGLFDRGSEIARTDVLVGVLSSLGRVGEIINRPTQEVFSQQSGVFGSTTVQTSNRSQPNILAAALEGFFTPTAERLRERSDRSTQELLKRGNVAIVPEGTEVSVFVNSFVFVRR
ncbi:MAG: hypothetical protein WBV73_12555 [Phormidium sp.]